MSGAGAFPEGLELRGYLKAAPHPVLLVDAAGTVLLANPAVRDAFGWDPEDLAGRPIEELLPEELREGHREQVQRYMRAPVARAMGRGLELRARRRDGSEFPVEISLAPIPTPAGLVVAATVVDMTRERALQDRLVVAQKMEAVGQLAGRMAHDFNGALAVITTYAELVQEDLEPGGEAAEDLGEILRAARRGAALTRRFLAFCRDDPDASGEVDLAATCGEVVALLERMGGEDIAVVLEVRGAPPPVVADPVEVEQLVLNLALNGLDAMKGRGPGTLTLRIAGEGGAVTLEVEDTGAGMDAATRARVLEPFFTTKPAGRGTGLGLAIVSEVVERRRGRLEIESTPGEGSRFRVVFPGAG